MVQEIKSRFGKRHWTQAQSRGAAEVVDGYRPAETPVDLGAKPDDFSVKGVLGRLAVGPFQQTSGAKHVARFEVLPRRRDEHRCRPLVTTWFALQQVAGNDACLGT